MGMGRVEKRAEYRDWLRGRREERDRKKIEIAAEKREESEKREERGERSE